MQELRALNLDDNEIKIYLTCLQLGLSKAKDIAKKSQIVRTTVYGILEALLQRGLVSKVVKDGITRFQATRPKELLEIIDEKRKKIASVVPDLERLHNAVSGLQQVEFFEGKNGVKAIVNEMISVPNQTVKLIGVVGKWAEYSKGYTATYYRKKKERNIQVRAIVPEEERGQIKAANTSMRYVKKLSINGSCMIYGDIFAFVSYDQENPRGFRIKDAEFNLIQNIMFDNLWNKAGRK